MHRIHDAFEERETPSQQGRRYSFDPAERAAAPADDPPRARVWTGPALALLLAVAVGAGAWWYMRYLQREQAVTQPAATPRTAESPSPPAQTAATEPPASGVPAIEAGEAPIHHPVEALPPARGEPIAMDADGRWRAALIDLVGQKGLAWLRGDGFVVRAASTVDHLGRSFAAPRRWPIFPIGGRFTVVHADGRSYIGAENARRYDAFVSFVSAIDPARAAGLYKRNYAAFQSAFEYLGAGGQYFNDRLVAVIDHLLATPEPAGRLEVRLVEIRGAPPSPQPWLHYEFADPALERLSAGQKMLLRAGPENRRRLKEKLAAFRAQVAQH